ncbi:MAG: cytochrome c maturation protein CcmE [Gammaproteobacteria bacterium]|nr:cytochrome c maturation protein CcmE [Gammaproteobacteria bacterium]MCY4228875.1 cytochrome c maturation protein CcmE [Gammaproteobacteria bacterium]
MQAQRKTRLLVVAMILAGVSISAVLALLSLNENINLFYSPSQVHAGEVPADATIRIGGMVVKGSVNRNPDSLEVSFDLTDTAKVVTVVYDGILPDLFREGQGIVASGKMKNRRLVADQVLAKHDETYMAPEISESIKAAHGQQSEESGY